MTKKEQTPNIYADLSTWVGEWLAPTYEQHITAEKVWCPEWWRHYGAVQRLQALWEAWEVMWPAGQSEKAAWFTSYGDPIMRALMEADGPFYGCKDHTHGEYAVTWGAGDRTTCEGQPPCKYEDLEVQQQAPQFIYNDDNELVEVRETATEGVSYISYRDTKRDETVEQAIALNGYRLHSGHRAQRPHPGGTLPLAFPSPETLPDADEYDE